MERRVKTILGFLWWQNEAGLEVVGLDIGMPSCKQLSSSALRGMVGQMYGLMACSPQQLRVRVPRGDGGRSP